MPHPNKCHARHLPALQGVKNKTNPNHTQVQQCNEKVFGRVIFINIVHFPNKTLKKKCQKCENEFGVTRKINKHMDNVHEENDLMQESIWFDKLEILILL